MPISQFSDGIQKFISFLPGTYGTALLHKHLMRGVLDELEGAYFPSEVVEQIRDGFDNNLYFLDNKVETSTMYLILGGSILALMVIYVLLNMGKQAIRRSK